MNNTIPRCRAMQQADDESARVRSGSKYFYGIIVAILIVLGITILFF